MAFSQFQRCLRLSLRPFPSRAVRRSSRLQPVSPASHPKQLALRLRRFGEASNHRHCPRNPHRAGASPSRRGERNCTYSFETAPGKPSADFHSAQRCDESAVLRSAACGRFSPSATPITLHTATVIRQQGLLTRVPRSGADAPAALHTPRKPRRHGVRKGKMLPAVRILPAAEQSASGLHRSSPGLGTVDGGAGHCPSA